MYSSINSLTSALDGSEWSALRPGRLTPSERAPGTHWIGGWVGPRADLDAVAKEKFPADRGVDRRIILEWILGKYGGKLWSGFIYLRIGTSGGVLWTR
jgi:hypothetical protein